MSENQYAAEKSKKIGYYLNCGFDLVSQGLSLQKRLASMGIKKRLGEVMLESQVISQDSLKEAIHSQRLDRLKMCRLFSGLTNDELLKFCDLVQERDVAGGEDFIHQDTSDQDTSGDCFFVIVEGDSLVYRKGDYGEEIPLETVEPGECLGEMGYFSVGRRSASVRALEDSQLFMIDYKELDRAFEMVPRLAGNFLDIVTGRLRRANLRFQEALRKSKTIERSLDSLLSFLDMSEIMTLRTGIEGLINRIVVMASQVMNADRASLFLIDAVAGELWSKEAQGEESREIRIPLGKGIVGWVAQHDQLLNIDDAYTDPRFNPEVDKHTGYRTKSVLCGPIRDLEGRILGVIQVINKKGKAFGDDDESLFQAFAYQTAIAVENFSLYKKILINHGKMAILLDVATALSQTLDLEALINKIIEKVSEILQTERSSLFLLDHETDELWSKVAQGAEVSEIRFPTSTGLAGYVASTGEVLNIEDAYKDPRFNPSIDQITGYRTKSVICVPVINRDGKIIGITQAVNKKEGAFDKEDEDLLLALSSQIAVAIENAWLFQENLEKQRMEEELSIARDLQTSMLPTACPDTKGFKIAALSTPAREVGGDFFDFIEMGTDKVGFVIGDVTGKSVSGALVMSASRSVFRMLSEQELTVAESMLHANRRLKKDVKSGMFVALLYAVLNSQDQILTLCSAGQIQPVLMSAKTGVATLVETRGDTFPLGILDEVNYEETRLQLVSGDKVVFYTDGIVEAMNEKQEMFGFDRLVEVVQGARSMSAESLLKEIMHRVNAFVGAAAQHDDLTVIVVSVEA
jgi:serine phosphatase RsbU (regulator of sigma subunit)/CRP-like cAMP-binding protein